MDPQTQAQATDTFMKLWTMIGILAVGNAGTIIKIFMDRKEKQELKAEAAVRDKEQSKDKALTDLKESLDKLTHSMNEVNLNLRRLYSATKLLAGKKWENISKAIQEEHPR